MKCVKLPDREKCTIKKMVTAEKQASPSKTTCHVLQLSNSLTEFPGFCQQDTPPLRGIPPLWCGSPRAGGIGVYETF